MESRRNATTENALKKWLRSIPDTDRFEFISKCLDYRGYASENFALQLATSCINLKNDALAIFHRGLLEPDASSIKFWLDFAIRKLGAKSVILEIASRIDSHPDLVDKALYWLPSLVPKSQAKARGLLEKLHKDAKKRNIIKGPKVSIQDNGSVLFSNIYPKKKC